jgi:hypothetical protein
MALLLKVMICNDIRRGHGVVVLNYIVDAMYLATQLPHSTLSMKEITDKIGSNPLPNSMKSHPLDEMDTNAIELTIDSITFGIQYNVTLQNFGILDPFVPESTMKKRIDRLNYKLQNNTIIHKMMILISIWMFSTGVVIIMYKSFCVLDTSQYCSQPWHVMIPSLTFILMVLVLIVYTHYTRAFCLDQVVTILKEFTKRDRLVSWTLNKKASSPYVIEIRYPKSIDHVVEEGFSKDNGPQLKIDTSFFSSGSEDSIPSPDITYSTHTGICF